MESLDVFSVSIGVRTILNSTFEHIVQIEIFIYSAREFHGISRCIQCVRTILNSTFERSVQIEILETLSNGQLGGQGRCLLKQGFIIFAIIQICLIRLSVSDVAQAMPRQRSILNENTKIGVVVHVVQNKKIFVISRCCFAEDGKEMYKDLQRRCRAIVLLIKPFVLCLRSLLIIHRRGSRCPENAELRLVTFL